ncbi:hypothetical protein EDD18DRAFT_1111015 [Armillaria luteobubalina]|uniref:Uncharacterized protein n=1 Tax=Armillaria luteobubalina TaxID=153913 RepID=A0AA39UGU2_9AGAR|nr:hypothetical protein EDD18DRAFT_1111015 [Armillaria luteobubalina]
MMKMVEQIHPFMLNFSDNTKQPFPTCIEAFLATILHNLFNVPAKLCQGSWHDWALLLNNTEQVINWFREYSKLPLWGASPVPSEDEDTSSEDDSGEELPDPRPPPPKCSKVNDGSSKCKQQQKPAKVEPAPDTKTMLAKEITNMIDDQEMTPVMVDTLLQCTGTDLAIIGVLQILLIPGHLGCIQCAAKCITCKHSRKATTCPNCTKSRFCSCFLSTGAWHEAKIIVGLTVLLQKVYKACATSFANITVALEHIEENHGTDATLDISCKLPASCRLFIKMGHLVGDSFKQKIEDVVQSKVEVTKDFAQASVLPPLEESTPSAGPGDEAPLDNGQEAPLLKAIDLLGMRKSSTTSLVASTCLKCHQIS